MGLLSRATKDIFNRYPDLPDDNFGYSVHYVNPPISATPCMMLSVFAMRELATQDFESKFEGKIWAMYSYPEVKISFTPKSEDTSTVRWAMWSLAAAIRDMMVRSRFQTAQFETHYSAVQIGTLKFFVPESIGAEAEANYTELASLLTPARASAANGSDIILTNSSNLEDDPRSLSIQVTFKTTEIPRRDVFLSIVQALLNLGPLDSTTRITQPLAITGNALTVKITTSFAKVERSAPPYLIYRHVVSALGALPRLMLREGKFVEVEVRLFVDSEHVGNGMIQRGPRIGLAVPVTANVSVS